MSTRLFGERGIATSGLVRDLREVSRPRRTGFRRWGWREAVIAAVLFVVPGTVQSIDVAFPRATYPAPHVAYSYHPPILPPAVVGLLVVAFIWVLLMTSRTVRLPGAVARLITVLLFVQFTSFVLPGAYELRHGSDNVEALEVGALALLHLDNPYLAQTHYGNPVAPLLGGLLLVVPLVALMHTLDLINVIWLGVCAVAVDRYWGPWAACAMVLYFTLLPWTRLSLPLANDHAITAAGVVLFGSVGFHLASREKPVRPLLRWLWAALFACALVYRVTMWVAVVPLAVLFVRQLGWTVTLRWMLPASALSITLLAAPLAFDPSAYIDGPLRANFAKGTSGSVPHASAYIALATITVLLVGSWLVRTLAGAWGVVAAALATMLTTVWLCRVPQFGALDSYRHYETLWYQGWVFVFALAALLCPRPDKNVQGHESTIAIEAAPRQL